MASVTQKSFGVGDLGLQGGALGVRWWSLGLGVELRGSFGDMAFQLHARCGI